MAADNTKGTSNQGTGATGGAGGNTLNAQTSNQSNNQSNKEKAQSAADDARQKAQSAANDAKQKAQNAASDAGESAKREAQGVRDRVAEEAKGLRDRAQETIRSSVSERKDRAADELGNVAEALRKAGQDMRDQDYAGVADYAERLAQRVEGASDYIKQQDVGDFVQGLEGFAKREPAIFIGGAVALGVVAARFSEKLELTQPRGQQREPGLPWRSKRRGSELRREPRLQRERDL